MSGEFFSRINTKNRHLVALDQNARSDIASHYVRHVCEACAPMDPVATRPENSVDAI